MFKVTKFIVIFNYRQIHDVETSSVDQLLIYLHFVESNMNELKKVKNNMNNEHSEIIPFFIPDKKISRFYKNSLIYLSLLKFYSRTLRM